jgi:Uncharacterized protein conserved in bacteria (DUF2252)
MKRTTTLPDSDSPQPLALTIPTHQVHPSRAELVAMGKALRDKCPRTAHAEWNPPHDRPSPVRLVKQSNQGRIPDLVPIRHGRMLQSPFTFYRGAALNMAADLASTLPPGSTCRPVATLTLSISAASLLPSDG